MQFKILGSFLLAVIATTFLSSCAKTNYDGSTRVQPMAAQQAPPTPSTPPAQNRGVPPVAPPVQPTLPAGNLPVINFVQDDVLMDSRMEARLELQLSEASKLPVTAVINLVNGSALHYRDFAGFRSRSSETSQTVVFAPGTTRMPLPVIGGRRTRFCDTSFTAVISANRLQNAKVIDDSARITLPCEMVEPAPDAPVFIPAPNPPIAPVAPIVQTPAPVQPAPCDMVQARFENTVVENREHAKKTSVTILLDRVSELPVIFDLETNDGSALQNIDYVKVRVQLTIPPGQTAIEVPIALLKNKRCRTSDMHRWQQHAHFEFQVRITAMSNANMLQPAAVIVLKKDVDDDHCSAAPVPVPVPAPAAN